MANMKFVKQPAASKPWGLVLTPEMTQVRGGVIHTDDFFERWESCKLPHERRDAFGGVLEVYEQECLRLNFQGRWYTHVCDTIAKKLDDSSAMKKNSLLQIDYRFRADTGRWETKVESIHAPTTHYHGWLLDTHRISEIMRYEYGVCHWSGRTPKSAEAVLKHLIDKLGEPR